MAMDMDGLVAFPLLVGLAAGCIMKSGFGLISDLIAGVVGALVHVFLLAALGAPIAADLLSAVLAAIVGAVALLFVLRLIKSAWLEKSAR